MHSCLMRLYTVQLPLVCLGDSSATSVIVAALGYLELFVGSDFIEPEDTKKMTRRWVRLSRCQVASNLLTKVGFSGGVLLWTYDIFIYRRSWIHEQPIQRRNGFVGKSFTWWDVPYVVDLRFPWRTVRIFRISTCYATAR